MIQTIVRWVLIPSGAAILAALLGGPVLGYDPLVSLGFAIGASLVVLNTKLAPDALFMWGCALGLPATALAFVPQIPLWLEFVAEGALGVSVACLVTLVVTYMLTAVNWVRTRAWHY
jgi:hypothetical protein